jgi:tetratricopeptide (TPR) repeat protein
MGEILPALCELHHRACKQAGEDPKTLAKRLFDWEMKSDWDIFSGAAEVYADVLGSQGLAEYRRFAEAVWAEVPALGPGDDSHERFHARFRITSMMESLARQSGNYEELVAVKCHDLSLPYSFLQIAEIYRQANKYDQALEWAEKGMRLFSRHDSRLSDFLADEYHRRGRHSESMDLIWAQFTDRPQLETYRKLQAHATLSDKLQFVADDERVAEDAKISPATEQERGSTLNSKLKARKSKPTPAVDKLKFVGLHSRTPNGLSGEKKL